jgi:hypothetical protein
MGETNVERPAEVLVRQNFITIHHLCFTMSKIATLMRTTIALTVVIGLTATLTLPNMEMSAQAQDQNNIFGPNSSMKFANIFGILNKASTFNTVGISMVRGVKVTAINVIGNNELSVTLRYTGGFTTPAVTVIGFSGTINPQELTLSFLDKFQLGSTVVNGRWTSPVTVTMGLLGGNTTSYSSSTNDLISAIVVVVPYTP